MMDQTPAGLLVSAPNAWHRFLDSDFVYSFRQSPTAIVAAVVLLLFVLVALLAPWLAPQNPFDPAALELINSRIPPAWLEGGQARFPLGRFVGVDLHLVEEGVAAVVSDGVVALRFASPCW